MPLINCEISLQLLWSANRFFTDSTGVGAFAITDTKLYVPLATLTTLDNTELLKQLKSGFKQTIK